MTRFHFERSDGPPPNNVQTLSEHLNPFIPPQGFPLIAPIFFDTSNDATFVTGITWSTDENTMFIIDSTARKVLQYNVPVASDISSIVDPPVSFTIDVLDANFPTDITFATGVPNEGRIMYISTTGPIPAILQYQLSSPFDISTIINPLSPFIFSIPATAPTGVVLSLNGDKMFVADQGNGTLLEFAVIVPFQISTIVAAAFVLILPGGRVPGDVTFDPNDGTKMFVTDAGGGGEIVQYSLSIAFDLSSTVTEIKELDVSSLDTNPFGIVFSNIEPLLFFVGNTSDGVFQILLENSFELP